MDWKLRAGSLGGRFLGAVLLTAALAKAIEPGAFAEQIRLEGLDFLVSAGSVVLIALALETGMGMLLLLGFHQRGVLIPSAVLVGFFLFLTGRNYWLVLQGLRDENASCGCFGSLIERTAAQALWQDLLLLLPALLLAFWGGRRADLRWSTQRLSVTAVSVALVVSYAGSSSDLRFVEMAAAIADTVSEERFLPVSDYSLLANGETVSDAEIYHSEQAVSFLILSAELPSVLLLEPRTGLVRTVRREEIVEAEDGSLFLSREARPQEAAQFEVSAKGISFTLNRRHLLLAPAGRSRE